MAFPATFNIDYYKGDTYEMIVYPKNSDGSSWNLSGYILEMAISDQLGKSTTRFQALGTVAAFSIPNPPTGLATDIWGIKCTIFPSVGVGLIPGEVYYYDVTIKKTVNNQEYVYTIVKGTISVSDGVFYGQ